MLCDTVENLCYKDRVQCYDLTLDENVLNQEQQIQMKSSDVLEGSRRY